MLLELVTASYLVLLAGGGTEVFDQQPNNTQYPAGSTVLLIPPGMPPSQFPFCQSDGNGNAVYVAPTPPAPPAPGPNAPAFIAALQADSTIQPIYFLLSPYEYTLSQYSATTAPAIKAIWAQLCAQYGGSFLTPTLQTAIQNYAITNNMPLQ